MAYVAVRGGGAAIEASLALAQARRTGTGAIIPADAVLAGMRGLIDQVMSEGSVYAESVAALAVKQAEGSPEEAVFLLRAFRSTLPRLHYSLAIETEDMRVVRRISASFKDIPGGQILGPSLDYSHRLIDFGLWDEKADPAAGAPPRGEPGRVPLARLPKVIDYIRSQGLLPRAAKDDSPPKDVTKESLSFPATRSQRLQVLTRGQTGAITALGYAGLRGYGLLHPTVGELRVGYLSVEVADPLGSGDPDDSYYVGEVLATEVESLIPVSVPLGRGKTRLEFDVGYGFAFGQNETKAIAMSIVDQGLERPDPSYAAQDEEFVLTVVDSVEATGFISHLKLPHYVTFQSKLDAMRAAGSGRSGEAPR